MKFKICYVLTSCESDNYLEEAYVSMYSARHHNPDAHIVLVIDDKTNETLKGVRKEEVKYADEIKVVSFDPKYNAKKRSRLLKTMSRELIKGDMLYIDTDTIVVKPLDELDDIVTGDLAGVYDLHSCYYHDCFTYEFGLVRCRKMGWEIPADAHYFNGGMTFSRDTDTAHKFYKLWNENLLACFDKDITTDQQALFRTDYLMGNIIQPLEGVWNCQLPHGMQYFWGARVIHYFGSRVANNKPLFMLRDRGVTDKIKQTGEISAEVKEVVREPMRGLAPCVFTIAGDDIDFMRSKVYLFLRHRFRTPFFNVVTKIVMMLSAIKRTSKMLTRRGDE